MHIDIKKMTELAADADRRELAHEAVSFYSLPEVREIAAPERLKSVLLEISMTGTYSHTQAELLMGAKLAWRNHARCVGRYVWRTLKLIDARHCETAEEIAEFCWEHLRVSTNNGKVRPSITVFRPSRGANRDIRIVNHELIRYAGYPQSDGSCIGDPQYAEFTDTVTKLGWKGAGTAYDVLPLMIYIDDKPPAIINVPREYVLEVPIRHPRLDWFEELGLRWHANPAVSNMCLEVGGLRYTAAPFTGWYVNPEIGARNFSDTYRYDMLPEIARRMGLDTHHNASLWRDRALVELNQAVLYSYAEAGVYMADHHTASAQFLAHVEREEAAGRAVPTDWTWVNPPMSASTVGTYHRTFDPPDEHMRPSFYRQDEPSCPASATERS
jgi:nitric-oxide synthase